MSALSNKKINKNTVSERISVSNSAGSARCFGSYFVVTVLSFPEITCQSNGMGGTAACHSVALSAVVVHTNYPARFLLTQIAVALTRNVNHITSFATEDFPVWHCVFRTANVSSFMNWICQSTINSSKTDINVITVGKRPGGTAAVLASGNVSASVHPQQRRETHTYVTHTEYKGTNS